MTEPQPSPTPSSTASAAGTTADPAAQGDLFAAFVPPTRHWWLLLISGLLSVIVGIIAVAIPGVTLVVIGLMFGISLIFTGAGSIAIGVSGRGTAGSQTLAVLVGFVAIVGGLFCLIRPGAGLIVVVLAVAFWFFIVGIGDLVTAFQDPKHRFWRGLLGVIGIAAGVVLVVDPVIGLSTLALLAGLGFLLRGITEIALAFQLRRVSREAGTGAANRADTI